MSILHHMHLYQCEQRRYLVIKKRTIGKIELITRTWYDSFIFIGIAGDLVEFNDEGDGLGRYDVYQYQKLLDGGYGYVKIGEWIDR